MNAGNKQLEENFTLEAQDKLSPEKIKEILDKEQCLIQKAAEKHIPESLWMGYNTKRYCKDLLRSHQPGFWLYQLINFLAQSSCVLLFFILILYGIDHIAPIAKHSPIYLFLPLTFILPLWKMLFAAFCKGRIHTFSNKAIQICRLFSLCLFTIGAILVAFYLRKQIWGVATHLSVLSAFLFYVAMMLISGIHNVIYQSSFVDFFCIGTTILRKNPEKTTLFIEQYLAHKKSKEQALNTMISARIYLFLAIVILLSLTITGGYQYYFHQDLSLGIFVILSFALLCVCLYCLMCAHTLIKVLKKSTH